MLDLYKHSIANQFDATLCTINTCIARCPDSAWDEPVVNLAFNQAAFHTLFFADYYLGHDEESLRNQPFHIDNPQIFRDYEELVDRKQVLMYDKPSLKAYLQHCRTKAAEVLAAETFETLQAPCGFRRKDFSRAELHVTNIRHLAHHAAQLIMRLRLDHQADIPWFASGWRDA